MGAVAIALSTANIIRLASVRAEIKAIANTMGAMKTTMSQRSAEISHVNEGQQKISEVLNYTQMALNQTIHLVNQHSDILNTHEAAIKKLIKITTYLNDRMAAFIHVVDILYSHSNRRCSRRYTESKMYSPQRLAKNNRNDNTINQRSIQRKKNIFVLNRVSD
jgi:hypothetical protein